MGGGDDSKILPSKVGGTPKAKPPKASQKGPDENDKKCPRSIDTRDESLARCKFKTERSTVVLASKEKLTVSKARSLKSKDAAQKQQKKPAKKPREKMADGELCKSHEYTWKVIKILGSGGFGDVYKVVKNGDEDKNEYAMKTEMVIGERRMLRLKIEVACMMQCRLSKEGKKHFVELVDRGKTDKFNFVVMGLVGSSLDDYRKNNKVDFTLPTAMQVAVQTLEAIRDLHKVGWLHRDIKPQNFAHGIGDNEGTVFVLDFGIARKIYYKNQVLKKPRAKIKFLGTLRYASRACHHGAEQGRKDDMETWLYLMLDLFNRVKGLTTSTRATTTRSLATRKRGFWWQTLRVQDDGGEDSSGGEGEEHRHDGQDGLDCEEGDDREEGANCGCGRRKGS